MQPMKRMCLRYNGQREKMALRARAEQMAVARRALQVAAVHSQRVAWVRRES